MQGTHSCARQGPQPNFYSATSIFGSSRRYKTRRTTRKPLVFIRTARSGKTSLRRLSLTASEDEGEQKDELKNGSVASHKDSDDGV
jgi:hypothetical protein